MDDRHGASLRRVAPTIENRTVARSRGSADQPPAGSGWIHEIKHGGFRIPAQQRERTSARKAPYHHRPVLHSKEPAIRHWLLPSAAEPKTYRLLHPSASSNRDAAAAGLSRPAISSPRYPRPADFSRRATSTSRSAHASGFFPKLDRCRACAELLSAARRFARRFWICPR